jgi:hypothetical protein
LNHSIDNNLGIPREKVIDFDKVTGYVDSVTPREVSDQPLKGGGQAEILKDLGAQVIGETLDIFNDLINV